MHLHVGAVYVRFSVLLCHVRAISPCASEEVDICSQLLFLAMATKE